MKFRIVLGMRHQHADAPRLLGLLCLRAATDHAAAAPRDELTPFHSMTSSARVSRVGGTVRPSAFAVLRLSARWNLVGCITGRSECFAPLSIRPVYLPAWR